MCTVYVNTGPWTCLASETGGDISWVIVVVMAATLLSYVPAHLGDAEKTERKLYFSYCHKTTLE